MGSPIDRTAKTALDSNLANGNISDAPKIKANNDVVYNYVDGLNSAIDTAAAATTLPHADSSVTGPKIRDGAVTTAKIADGAVTATKLSGVVIDSSKLVDGSVTTSKIALQAVGTEQIADGGVTAVKIANGVLTADKFVSGALQNETQNGLEIVALKSGKASQTALNTTNTNVANNTTAIALKANQSALDATNSALSLKASTTYVNTQIASVASGSPKGTYATLAALQAAYPTGNTNIYVVTADGNWYYWNGSAWTAGGAYQSTGIADVSVTPQKTSFISIGKNLFDKSTVTVGMFVNQTNGTLSANASYDASDFIEVLASTSYVMTKGQYMAFYDAAKTYISGVYGSGVPAYTITTPVNAQFIRVSTLVTDLDIFQFEQGTVPTTYESSRYTMSGNMLEDDSVSIDKTNFIVTGKNLYDPSVSTDGKYVNNVTGTIDPNAAYSASDYIAVLPSTVYTENLAYYMAFYGVAKTFISGITSSGSTPRTFTTPANAYYCRLSVPIGSKNTFQVELGSASTSYEPYGYKLSKAADSLANSFMPDITIPPTINAVVGKEINIYFENITNDVASKYQFDVTCSIGAQQNERWTCIPAAAGTFALTISIYKNFALLLIATTSVVVKAAAVGSGVNKKCMFIGDSTTNAGVYTQELLNLFGAGDPMDITLLGTRGTLPNRHEGRSGWTAALYVGQASFSGVTNAFWNPTSSSFDFSYYMNQQGYVGVDYVGIHLGINDIFSFTDDSSLNTEITNILNRFDTMINSIRAYNASVKIGILITIPPSLNQDAFGKDYADGQTRWRYKRNHYLFMQALTKKYQGQEASLIYLVPINVNLDTEHNMQTETVAVNSRNTTTVVRQSNGVHPADNGYYQMADVIYYWLKSFEV